MIFMANLNLNFNSNRETSDECVMTEYKVPFMVCHQNIRSMNGKIDEFIKFSDKRISTYSLSYGASFT